MTTEPPDAPPTGGGDLLDLARDRLGEPEASFRVGAARFGAKLALGAALVAYGVAANLLAWRFDVWGVEHVKLLILFGPPVTGLSILRQLFVSRGLAVHVYPAGLLRVQGRSLQSFAWADLAELLVRAEQATPLIVRDGGRVVDCRLVVTSPVFRLNAAAVVLKRDDGEAAEVTPAVAGYPELVEEVTSRTFAERWPRLLAELGAGGSFAFGPWAATPAGLRLDGEVVPWGAVRFVRIADKHLILERAGGRPDPEPAKGRAKRGKSAKSKRGAGVWMTPLESVPFPHLLVALLAEFEDEARVP